MLGEISFKQLLEWMEYDTLSPIGDKRGDWQAASICAAVTNAAAVMMRSTHRTVPHDFLLRFVEVPVMEIAKAVEEAPKPAAPNWHAMKFAAMQHAALANAAQKKKRK